jgi:GNAT superfamily N-acetyltransferase
VTPAVRRIRPDEGPLLKQVRLAALADAPGAFSATYADEAAFDDGVWDERAARGATDDDGGTGTFVLDAGGAGAAPVGIAVGYRPGPDPTRVELVSMWGDPSVRGTGAGRLLVDAVARWASDTGASALDLWVMRSNGGAQAFYERLGFTATDDLEVAPDDPCRDEVRMTRTVPQR